MKTEDQDYPDLLTPTGEFTFVSNKRSSVVFGWALQIEPCWWCGWMSLWAPFLLAAGSCCKVTVPWAGVHPCLLHALSNTSKELKLCWHKKGLKNTLSSSVQWILSLVNYLPMSWFSLVLGVDSSPRLQLQLLFSHWSISITEELHLRLNYTFI